MSRFVRKCYIAAPAGIKLNTVRKALSKRGIEVVLPEGLESGADLPSEISSVISKVDLVIGILTSDRRSSWVLFELGLAWARKCPIILIASPINDFIPSNLQRFLVLRAKPSNAEAIEFALDQFLAAPPREPQKISEPRHPQLTRGQPIGSERVHEVLSAIHDRDGVLLEKLVAAALLRSGAQVVSDFASGGHRGADMAIWSEPLDPIIGNPLLVEIKLQFQDIAQAKHAAYALAGIVAASGTQWGLLLYGEAPARLEMHRGWLPPNILAINLPSLFNRMRFESFSDVVKGLRNEKVHGSSP